MKLALYETGPGEVYGIRYGVNHVGLNSIRVTLFPATLEGLDDLIKSATKSNAIIVKLERESYTADNLLAYVRKLIKAGYGKKVFMPAIGIEKEIVE